jgi:hypothetical protein
MNRFVLCLLLQPEKGVLIFRYDKICIVFAFTAGEGDSGSRVDLKVFVSHDPPKNVATKTVG